MVIVGGNWCFYPLPTGTAYGARKRREEINKITYVSIHYKIHFGYS